MTRLHDHGAALGGEGNPVNDSIRRLVMGIAVVSVEPPGGDETIYGLDLTQFTLGIKVRNPVHGAL